MLDALHARGIPVLVTLWGSPRWANGGGAPNRLPADRLRQLRVRRRACASRGCACGRRGTSRTAARSRRPSRRGSTCSACSIPAYAALHARPARTRSPAASRRRASRRRACRRSRSCRGCALRTRVSTRTRRIRIPSAARETPTHATCSAACFTMATLPTIRADVTRYFGSKPLWLTEYGYQTNPPDRLLGVSLRAAGEVPRRGGAAGLAAARRDHAHPLPRPRRAEPRRLAERPLQRRRRREARRTTRSRCRSPRCRATGRARSLWGQVRPGSRRAQLRAAALGRRPLARRRLDGEDVAERRVHAARDPARAARRFGIFAPSVGWAEPAASLVSS